jgi:hypothetical protein
LNPWILTTPNGTVSYQENSVISIFDNSLRCYQTSFLSQFSNNPSNFDNAGIMILAPIVTPIQSIIRGNTVMQGSALTNVNTVVTYDYVNCAYIGVNCILDSNIFSNLQSTFDMVRIAANPAPITNITNNQFYRNGITVNSYINFFHPALGTISGNSFDSTTINGTSTLLIAGTISNAVFGPNYNYSPNLSRSIVQPLLNPAPLAVSSSSSPPDGAEIYFTKTINGATLTSVTLYYYNNSTGSTPVFFIFSINSTTPNAAITNVTGTQTGATGTGLQTATINLPANYVINDTVYAYGLFFENTSSTTTYVGAPICNFTNIGYPGQS